MSQLEVKKYQKNTLTLTWNNQTFYNQDFPQNTKLILDFIDEKTNNELFIHDMNNNVYKCIMNIISNKYEIPLNNFRIDSYQKFNKAYELANEEYLNQGHKISYKVAILNIGNDCVLTFRDKNVISKLIFPKKSLLILPKNIDYAFCAYDSKTNNTIHNFDIIQEQDNKMITFVNFL